MFNEIITTTATFFALIWAGITMIASYIPDVLMGMLMIFVFIVFLWGMLFPKGTTVTEVVEFIKDPVVEHSLEALVACAVSDDDLSPAQLEVLESVAISMVDSGTMTLGWAEVMVLATKLPTLEEYLFLQERAGNIAVGTKAHIMGLINSVA